MASERTLAALTFALLLAACGVDGPPEVPPPPEEDPPARGISIHGRAGVGVVGGGSGDGAPQVRR